MKRLTKAQWTNRNWSNRSVLAHRYSACIVRKNWPYPATTSGSYGREGGRPADKIWVIFEIFKILYRLNYSGFYFVYYHCNITTVLELTAFKLALAKQSLF